MHCLPRAALASLLALAAATTASALETVRFAQFKVTTLVPFAYGLEKGYFKDEGIDLQMINVQGGPAAGAAIASGSADIGYSAPPPIVNARIAGQPFRFFMGLEYEKFPDRLWGNMLASGKSGVKSFKDMGGKTMVVGPPGGLCEVGARDWLMKAGVPVESVKFLNNPFPQMQALLETGTADAACVAEPFATAIRTSKIEPNELGLGYLAEVPARYRIEGVFANESWIAANPKVIEGLKRAYVRANKDLVNDPALAKDILRKDYKLPPNVIEKIVARPIDSVEAPASEFQPMLDAMTRTGVLKAPVKADDLVAK